MEHWGFWDWYHPPYAPCMDYLPTWDETHWNMATFKGKCRYIFPTWSIWDTHWHWHFVELPFASVPIPGWSTLFQVNFCHLKIQPNTCRKTTTSSPTSKFTLGVVQLLLMISTSVFACFGGWKLNPWGFSWKHLVRFDKAHGIFRLAIWLHGQAQLGFCRLSSMLEKVKHILRKWWWKMVIYHDKKEKNNHLKHIQDNAG